MSGKRYTEEFKRETIKQINKEGYSVRSVALRLGVSAHSLYAWRKKYGSNIGTFSKESSQQEEIKQLKSELKRVTQERDILKKAAAYFASESR
jgi:transposase